MHVYVSVYKFKKRINYHYLYTFFYYIAALVLSDAKFLMVITF